MATDWYAPNQQAVRADGSGPAETQAPEQARRSSADDDKSSEKSESRKGSRKSGSEQ